MILRAFFSNSTFLFDELYVTKFGYKSLNIEKYFSTLGGSLSVLKDLSPIKLLIDSSPIIFCPIFL